MARPFFGEGSMGQVYDTGDFTFPAPAVSGFNFDALDSDNSDSSSDGIFAKSKNPGASAFDSDDDDDDDDDKGEFLNGGAFRTTLGMVTNSDGKAQKTPKHVGPYVLGGVLGKGAYAVVKEGIDSRSLRIVAVKSISRRFLRKIPNGDAGLKQEIAIMKSLGRSPYIIQLIEVIDERNANKIHIILELANGCTVQDLIDRAPNNCIPDEQCRRLFRMLLLGLKVIHGKNVVHRDIKPANLFLTSDAELKVSDFGVSEFLNKYEEADYVTRSSGSPAFQSPEIARGDRGFSGIKVDVWAAGVTLYYCLCGIVPFEGENLLLLFDKISAGKFDIPAHVHPDAADLIRHMLEVDIDKRYSVKEALKHPWLQSDKSLPTDNFVPIPKREPEVLKIISKMFETDAGDTPATADSNHMPVQARAAGDKPARMSSGSLSAKPRQSQLPPLPSHAPPQANTLVATKTTTFWERLRGSMFELRASCTIM